MTSTGTPLARAFVRLEVESGQATESIVSAVRSGGQKGQHEAESQGKQIAERLKKGLEYGAGFYGGEALFQGVKNAIQGVVENADQLTERTENVDRVFGESSESVLKFGRDAAKSYGLSAVSADQMSVKLGALFTNLGIGQDEAAKMSVSFVKLAADLAAFNHTDTASAEQALQNALSGRTQSLKQYGIVVDAVSVQQQALKDGLIHTIKDALTPAARAQAAYEVVLQRSQVQQGQFARSSNSLAEQTQILKAEVTDASAAIGQHLVPVLVDGAKGLQDIGREGAATVKFFENNSAAAIALAGVLGAAAIPKLTEFALTAERLVQTNIAAFFTSGAGGIRAMGAALLENPELYGVVAALTAAGVAAELFAGKEKAAAIDVQSLTDAVKQQDTVGGSSLSNEILKQFTDVDLGSKGENVLEYLQRYKVNISDLIEAINRGNLYGSGGVFDQLRSIENDPSVSGGTDSKLQKFFIGLSNDIDSTRKGEAALSQNDAEMKAQLDKTPQGRFVEFLGEVQKAQAALTKSTADNNQTIGGQIDLLKQYSSQADVTASNIQQHILDNIKTLAGEGANLQTLSANGVDPDFIKKLVAEGPEYVAAVASSSKALQVQLGQQFKAGLTQQMHTASAAARAEAPAAAAAVATAANFALQAQSDAMKTKFFTAVSSAVAQARTIASDGGRDTANAFGAKGEAGRNKVLQSFLKTLPDPVRQAALSALGIATDAGGKIPTNLASAINAHVPKASQAAENLRLAVQNKIDLLHGKTIDVSTQDNASAALNTINSDLKQLEGLNNTLKATRITAADGGRISGPGGPRDDVIPAWLSNGEHVTNAASTAANDTILRWMDSNPGQRMPGFAAGGTVDFSQDVLSTHPFVQSFADYLSSSSFGSVLSGATGGSTSSGANVELGRRMAADVYGWAGAEFDALNKLFTRESGWNANAVNSSSGAYGIPQALGHGHPFNLGDPQSQILWGLEYIKGRYGDPLAAWAHEAQVGWYHNGGTVPGKGNQLAVLEGGEHVSTAADMGQVVAMLGKLIKAVDRNAVVTGSSVASALNETARGGRLDIRTRTMR